MLSFLVHQLPGMGIGLLVGAFMPAVGRKLKALFVEESKAAESKVATYGADLKKRL
jgi:hypothetical protein